MTNPLVELQRLGQSPWHDNISRGLLTSGKLRKMVAAGDITGLTSNPTIFEQAISHGDDYDAGVLELARKGKDADAIFDTLFMFLAVPCLTAGSLRRVLPIPSP